MYELEDITEEKQDFVVDSDSKADWCCKIIKQEQAEFERLSNTIDEEIEILKRKKEQLEQQLTNKTGYLKSKLADYFETVEKKDLKTQYTYKLPTGTLAYIKPTIKYEHDDEKILQYLRDNDRFEYIDVIHKLKWSELKKNEDITKIDGVTEVQVPARFEVK